MAKSARSAGGLQPGQDGGDHSGFGPSQPSPVGMPGPVHQLPSASIGAHPPGGRAAAPLRCERRALGLVLGGRHPPVVLGVGLQAHRAPLASVALGATSHPFVRPRASSRAVGAFPVIGRPRGRRVQSSVRCLVGTDHGCQGRCGQSPPTGVPFSAAKSGPSATASATTGCHEAMCSAASPLWVSQTHRLPSSWTSPCGLASQR